MRIHFPWVGEAKALTAISVLIAVFVFLPSSPALALPQLDAYFPGYKPNTQFTNDGTVGAKVQESSGTFTYQIPLAFPKGRNNLGPEIGLTYSSADKDHSTFVGLGWSLSVPSITRFAASGTQDLYVKPLYRSSLDGELVALNTTNFTARFEQGASNTYVFDGSSWTVTTKQGVRYVFGSTQDSKQVDPANSSRIYRWYLAEVIDLDGNKVRYVYTSDSGEVYLDRIYYTEHSSLPNGAFEVRFDKELRPSEFTSYVSGFKVVTKYRLSKIRIFVQAAERFTYELSYGAGDNGKISLLTSVTEKGIDLNGKTTSKPPTVFSYKRNDQYSQQDFYPKNFTEFAGGGQMTDVNGDGLPDVVRAFKATHPTTNALTTTKEVFIKQNFDLVKNTSFAIPDELILSSDNNDLGVRMADMNNDGKVDFLVGNGEIWFGNGTSTWIKSTIKVPTAFNGFGPNGGLYSNGAVLIDLNRDGLTDILREQVAYLFDGVRFTTSTQWGVPVGSFSSQPRNRTSYQTTVMDLNGDGLSDLVWEQNIRSFPEDNDNSKTNINWGPWTSATATQRIFYNTGSSWIEDNSSTLPRLVSTGWFYPENNLRMTANSTRVVDVNGDGLQDLFMQFNDGAMDMSCGRQWGGNPLKRVYYNSGNGFTSTTVFGISNYNYLHKLDLINISGGSCIWMQNFFKDMGAYAVDTDGDLYIENVQPAPDGSLGENLTMRSQGDTLTGIVVPTGAKIDITYSAANNLNILNGTTLVRYHQQLPFNQKVVVSIRTDDKNGNVLIKKFDYRNGLMKKDPSRPSNTSFAGFEQVITQETYKTNRVYSYPSFSVLNSVDETKVVKTFFHQGNGVDSTNGELNDSYARAGLPYKQIISTSTGAIIEVDLTEYQDTVFTSTIGEADRFIVMPKRRLKELFDATSSSKSIAQEFTYDASGNGIDVTIGEPGSGISFMMPTSKVKRTQTEYAQFLDGRKSSYPTRIVESGLNTPEKVTEMYYDIKSFGIVEKGHLTKTVIRSTDSSQLITTKNSYDQFGLRIASIDGMGATTTFEYDTERIYPTTSTNPLGHRTSITKDLTTDLMIGITDENGRSLRYVRDGFGRELMNYGQNPLGIEVLYSSTTYFDTTSTLGRVERTIYTDTNEPLIEIEYLDGLGRKIQTRSQQQPNSTQFVLNDYWYDELGREATTPLSYFGTGTAKTNGTKTSNLNYQKGYDAVDRVIAIGNDRYVTNYLYSPLQVTEIDPRGKKKVYQYDIYQNLIAVAEMNGMTTATTTYEYNRDGKLTKITDANGNTRYFGYDVFGRLTYSTDFFSAGDVMYSSKTYVYDANGNLVTERWQDNKSITKSYDVLNRVVTISFNGTLQDRFYYDNCTNGITRICRNTGLGYDRFFAYDKNGNQQYLSTKIATTTYNEYSLYDRFGRVTSSTLADGTTVNYGFTGNWLTQVTTTEAGLTPKTAIKSATYYANGHPMRIVYGNQATTTYDLEQYGRFRLASILTQVNASTVQNYVYFYDNADQITGFRDLSNTLGKKNITYVYDDIGRLTKVSATTSAGLPLYTESYQYDAIGNILTTAKNSGTGPVTTSTYEYSKVNYANPHAATKITTSINGATTGYQQMYFDTHGNTSMIYTHDASGTEMLSKRLMQNYDVGNRVYQQIVGENTGTTFLYSPNGIRLSQNESGKITHYPSDSYNSTRNASGTIMSIQKHLTAFGKPIVSIDGIGTSARTLYQHPDHLNGASVITNEAKQVEQYLEYYPFGSIRTEVKAGTWSEQRKYTGHEQDASGLIYMKARYYEPTIGRFLSSDPAFWDMSLSLKDPQAWNSFAYARNSPVNLIDPDGRAFVPSFQSGVVNRGGQIIDWLGQGPVVTIKDTLHGMGSLPVNFVNDVYLTSNFSDGLKAASDKVSNMSVEQRLDALGSVSGAVTTDLAFSVITGGAAKGMSGIGTRSANIPTGTINTRFISTKDGILDVLPTQQRILRNQTLPYKRDGGIFKNSNSVLPTAESGYYTKYVVPVPGMSKSGTVRLITSKGGEQWITTDHYKSVISIKK